MKRRDFLKSMGMVAPVPFLLHNTPVSAFGGLSMFPVLDDCSAITDRVMVVIRLAGANDGLNMLIPVNQYDTYANLRPNIRIKDTGAHAYINLDTGLPLNDQLGLHPSFTGIKSLYEDGKIAIVNGVGYPSANRSHFASENTMFVAKDGNSNNVRDNGWVGDYLNRAFPGSADNPTEAMPDPLGIQLGEKNTILSFYSKAASKNTSYNLTGFQSALLNIPNPPLSSAMPAPAVSDYADALAYVGNIERAMDAYYDRVFGVYTVGRNSTVVYPDTSLGNQLKIIARLIKGGSRTRIYFANLGGFDNHVEQVVQGNSHRGKHAELLSEFNDAVLAFQTDIANLGIEDRVVTVTFSEFGRTVTENSNFGTDHGDLAPMLVIGKNIVPGINGDHPDLGNLGEDGSRYSADERKFDYRQVYTTLLQDWLGASDDALVGTPLKNFTNRKLDLIPDPQNADPDCLTESLLPTCTETTLEEIVTEAIVTAEGWTYYAPAGYTGTEYLFAVEHMPSGEGANTENFTLQVKIKKTVCGVNNRNYLMGQQNKEATFVPGQLIELNVVGTPAPNGFVNMRLYQDNTPFENAATDANQFKIANDIAFKSGLIWVKSSMGFNPETDIRENGLGFNMQVLPLPETITGVDIGRDFFQWNGLNSFDGDYLLPLIRVTDKDGFADYPSNPEPGFMWFNSSTGKLMGYDGVQWKELKKP